MARDKRINEKAAAQIERQLFHLISVMLVDSHDLGLSSL
jgi:hypothetical protein